MKSNDKSADASMAAGRAKATFAGETADGPMVPDAQIGENAEPPMTPDAQIAEAGAPAEEPMVPKAVADESGGVVAVGAGGPLHDAVVEIAGGADEGKPAHKS